MGRSKKEITFKNMSERPCHRKKLKGAVVFMIKSIKAIFLISAPIVSWTRIGKGIKPGFSITRANQTSNAECSLLMGTIELDCMRKKTLKLKKSCFLIIDMTPILNIHLTLNLGQRWNG